MRERETVEFRVSRLGDPDGKGNPQVEWLDAAGRWGAEPDAAEFVFHVSPTGRERLRIDDEIRQSCGSRELAARLYAEQATTRASVVARLKATIAEAQQAALLDLVDGGNDALDALLGALENDPWHRTEVAFLVDLNEQIGALSRFAQWRVLQARVPEGWEDLGNLPLDDAAFFAVVGAFQRALGGARATPGKGRSPAS